MDGTQILQGTFTSTGLTTIIPIPSGVDWMRIYNLNEAHATNAGRGFEYFWQRGFAQNTSLMWYHPAGDHTVAIDTSTGFTAVDTSVFGASAPVAVTATTNVVAPVISTGTTTGVAVGSIVRLSGLAAVPNICGIDFTVGAVNPGVSITTAYNLATAPGFAGGAGFYRIITPAPWYPRRRTVINITQAAQAVITTSVTNQFTVGQQVRFQVPAACGMTEINGLIGTVVAVAAASFTVNIDTTAFTAFAWPAVALVPFTPAEVVPVGEDTAYALSTIPANNILDDATINTAIIGMSCLGGTTNPMGTAGDVIYWRAGKSVNV